MASGCVLNEASICQLGDCIQKVKGLPSNSASPSDTWLLEFKPGTIYIDSVGKSIEIPNAFCKIFIEPASLEKWLVDAHSPVEVTALWANRYLSLKGLEYELYFSEMVQSSIIDGKKSPHFIRTFSIGKSCKFNDLDQTLQKGGVSYSNATLARNMYYSLELSHTRPSVSVPTILSWPKDWSEFNFSFLLNQQIDVQKSKTFHEWIKISAASEPHILFLLLFQICQACYALYSEQSCHNDLHSGNVWITIRPEIKKNIKYIIGSKQYIFPEVYHLSRIFDFDRSYSETLGSNPILQTSLCQKSGQCNKVIESKDFVKLLCYVVKVFKGNALMQQQLRSIVIEEGKLTQALTLFNKLESLSCHPAEEVFKEDLFKEFPPYPIILDNIHNLWKRYSATDVPDDIKIDETFILSAPGEDEPPSLGIVDFLPEPSSPIVNTKSAPQAEKSDYRSVDLIRTVPL